MKSLNILIVHFASCLVSVFNRVKRFKNVSSVFNALRLFPFFRPKTEEDFNDQHKSHLG